MVNACVRVCVICCFLSLSKLIIHTHTKHDGIEHWWQKATAPTFTIWSICIDWPMLYMLYTQSSCCHRKCYTPLKRAFIWAICLICSIWLCTHICINCWGQIHVPFNAIAMHYKSMWQMAWLRSEEMIHFKWYKMQCWKRSTRSNWARERENICRVKWNGFVGKRTQQTNFMWRFSNQQVHAVSLKLFYHLQKPRFWMFCYSDLTTSSYLPYIFYFFILFAW